MEISVNNDFETGTPDNLPGWPRIIRSGILYAVAGAVIYQVVGFIGTFIEWQRQSSAREWILAAVIGFLIGCLMPLRGKGKQTSVVAVVESAPEDSSTLQEQPPRWRRLNG